MEKRESKMKESQVKELASSILEIRKSEVMTSEQQTDIKVRQRVEKGVAEAKGEQV